MLTIANITFWQGRARQNITVENDHLPIENSNFFSILKEIGREIAFKGLSNTQCMKGTNLANGAECAHKYNMLLDAALFLVLEANYMQRSNPS